MQKEFFSINQIPAVLWGKRTEKLIIAVHGNHSNKTDLPIEYLAQAATTKGYQILSFDLPQHGERKNKIPPCKMVPLYFLFYFFNEIMLLYIEDKLIAYKTTFFDWNRDDDVNIGLPSVKLLDAKIPHILVGVHHNRFGNVHQKHTLQTSLCALVEYTVSTPCKAIFYGAPQSVWLVHYWVCYRRQRHFLAF